MGGLYEHFANKHVAERKLADEEEEEKVVVIGGEASLRQINKTGDQLGKWKCVSAVFHLHSSLPPRPHCQHMTRFQPD